MNARTVCVCIVIAVALVALLVLFYVLGSSGTGALATNICPAGSTPVISGEKFLQELSYFEQEGFECFFGYDGITICCARAS